MADREQVLELLNSPQHAPMFTHGPDGECTVCPVPLYECGPDEIADALVASDLLAATDPEPWRAFDPESGDERRTATREQAEAYLTSWPNTVITYEPRDALARVPQGAAEPSDERVSIYDLVNHPDTAEPWTDPKPWVTPSGRVAHPLPGTWYASRPRSKAEFDADPDWADPTPWFRWCDSEMPDAPLWERYADMGSGTEFKPRPRPVFDAQNGAVRG